MYIKYIKNDSYKNLFFIFLLFNAVTAKLDRKALPKKKKKKEKEKRLYIFSNEKFLVIKQLSISTYSTYLVILLLLNILLQCSVHLSKPLVLTE